MTTRSPEDIAEEIVEQYTCSHKNPVELKLDVINAIKAERENIQHTYKQQNIRMTNNRFVKFCSHEKLKDLIRKGKVVVDHASDDGEYIRFHIPVGAHSVHLGMWTSDLGKEHQVSDTPKVSPKLVEQFPWLFEVGEV